MRHLRCLPFGHSRESGNPESLSLRRKRNAKTLDLIDLLDPRSSLSLTFVIEDQRQASRMTEGVVHA